MKVNTFDQQCRGPANVSAILPVIRAEVGRKSNIQCLQLSPHAHPLIDPGDLPHERCVLSDFSSYKNKYVENGS